MSELPLLEFRGVGKSFTTHDSEIWAHRDVSFSVRKGSIHALVGENGAGKSTLMKVLFGLEQPSEGQILLRGKSLALHSPAEARHHGLGMVHQHFMLAGPITALDHIFLEDEMASSWKTLPRQKCLQQMMSLSERFQMPVPWEQKIEQLSVGIQQRIEILKILRHEAEILILDEPTAVLTPPEVQAFGQQLKDLRAQGKTILLITHKLKEVVALADDVSVLRRGRLVHTGSMKNENPQSLSEHMMGRRLGPLPDRLSLNSFSGPLLQVSRLSYEDETRRWLKDVSFQVHAGEIVGIAGVEGNGQSQLLNALIRPQFLGRKLSGQIEISGQPTMGWESWRIRELGLAYFPEDRLHQALLLKEKAPANFLLGQQRSNEFQRWGFLRWALIRAKALAMMQKFQVRPESLEVALENYSGGNQQKFVVGRELHRAPKILIAAQPSRGVDIGAIEQIHSEIILRKNSGAAVLVVSSELDELMQLSDRILVMASGQIVAEFSRDQFDEMKIGLAMTSGGTTA